MEKIKKILVIVNYSKKDVQTILDRITAYFSAHNIEISVFAHNESVPESILSSSDIAFSLGGDGTLLHSARLLLRYRVPILGVNLGDFGFITEISSDEWIDAYEKYVSGELGLSERLMVNVRLERNGALVREMTGLNEAVIGADGIARLVCLQVYLGRSYVGRYRADGVIVATPTGSTAYSMAAEGPILHPDMEAMILNPICPFTLSNRPIVVPGQETIRIEVECLQRAKLVLTVDGQELEPLEPEDKVIIRKADIKCRIIRSSKRNFYEVLRSKLNWSGEPNA